ncbi:MAG: double-strand break repair helicase AddA, partial [Rhodobacterales bacterium]|nr:double-strand break repair helicase AddA [Rhodobacterales bacterium]
MNRPLGRQPNQLRAADPATSAWVTANAGTGKTRVLVDRVLRLLLAGTAPSRILCLTFTKAAAAEMANRLAETLGAWSTMADGDLDDHLRALTSKDPDAADRRRARRLFAETLEAPGGLNLRTIHSFCESLLGRFPVEARVAPHFTVIDERTAREWLREARNRVFRRLDRPQATALRQAMDHLAGTTDEDRFDRLMADLNARRGRLARALEATGGLDGAKARVRAALDLPEGLDEATVRDGAIAGADWAALNPAIDLMATSNDTDKKHARLLAGGRDGHLDFEAYKAVFLVKAGRRKNLIAKQLERDYPAIARALAVEQDRVEALAETLKALALARSTEALLTVGQALVAAYADIKGARAGLDYDDLIGAARALLEDDGRVGWVHYKLDGGIDHVLVDEAQDTSPDQWAVIEALVADFTAGEGAREGVERTLFVVGDEKQSIYSFQGADLDTFRARHVRFKRRFGAAGKAWEDVRLETSFRSTRPVLDLVDQVFNQAPEGVVEAGALHHETGRPGLAGLVELWPLLEPVEAPEEDPWDAPLDHTTADSPDRRLAEAVARRVAGWLKAGERLPGAGRPLAAGDVMILVQRRATFYQHMVRALKHHNVPVAGADRMVLTREMAVMDLMALGRFLLFPDDDLSLAGVLKSPLIGLDEDALFELAHGRGKGDHLWPTLRRRAGERADFAAAAERLSAWLGRADREAPYDFLTELLGPGKGRQRFLARLGVDANDAIDEFLGLALLYEREHPPAWQGFLSWVEAGATEVKRDLEQVKDAVRVMTVHGSKGLEAPVVILPDTVRVPDPNKDTSLFWTDPADGGPSVPLWVPSKEDDVVATETLREARNTALRREYRRLLYVAMTRARERVYLGGWRTKKAPAEGNWHDLVSAVLATDDDKIALDDGTEA